MKSPAETSTSHQKWSPKLHDTKSRVDDATAVSDDDEWDFVVTAV